MRKPTRPKLIPSTGVPRAERRAEGAQHRPVAAEHDQEVEPVVARRADLHAGRSGRLLDPASRSGHDLGPTGRPQDGDPANGLGHRAAAASASRTKNSRLPLGPRSGDGSDAERPCPPLRRARQHLVDDAPVHLRVAHDAALADLGRTGLELRLDEDDRPPRRAQRRRARAEAPWRGR